MGAPLRFGLFVPQGDIEAGILRDIACTAEQSGFHSLWVYDHLYNYPSPAHPEVLDALSGGRLEFGYGAGWHEEEFGGYGYDFAPAPTRIAMMEEGLTVIKALWSGQ